MPRESIQLGYRHAKVAPDFIPGGETINYGSVKVSWQLREDLSVPIGLQYEKGYALILAPQRRRTGRRRWMSRFGRAPGAIREESYGG
jgi:hypothetical protein